MNGHRCETQDIRGAVFVTKRFLSVGKSFLYAWVNLPMIDA